MVDWEEIWEDFDLKRGLIILAVGIVIIAAGVFVVRDYLKAERLKSKLSEDLELLNTFQGSWEKPKMSAKEMQDKIAELKSKLDGHPKVLPHASPMYEGDEALFDGEKIEAELRRVAEKSGVKITKIQKGSEGIQGYLFYEPLVVTFEGSRGAISTFLYAIDDMPYLNEKATDRITTGGEATVTIRFFKFDVESWKEANICQTSLEVPKVEPPDVSGVIIFKGDLEAMRNDVLNKQQEIKAELGRMTQSCELEKELNTLEKKLSLIEEKSK